MYDCNKIAASFASGLVVNTGSNDMLLMQDRCSKVQS